MKFYLVPTLLLAAGVSCAPPIQTTTTTTEAPSTTAAPVITTANAIEAEDFITGVTDPALVVAEVTTVLPTATTTEEVATTTTTEATTTTTTPTTTTTTTPPPPPRLNAKEREALIAHLGNIDLRNTDTLVLTPRQRLAIAQELEYQQLGLPAFSDPTPWQRLSREEQLEFNRKYLALPTHLQEYSRNQFLSLPDARQEKAYNTFVRVDIETLTRAIQREFTRERAALERRSQEERRREEENIHRLLDVKKMEYSAMNAEIVTDILDNNIDSDGSDLIKILKQQLSNSLQVALDNDHQQSDQIVVTTSPPEQSRSQTPIPPRSDEIKFHRLNSIDPNQEYLSVPVIKSSPRVPKSNSSILSNRASLFARRFQAKSPSKISVETRRSNLARLMYDPRRKF